MRSNFEIIICTKIVGYLQVRLRPSRKTIMTLDHDGRVELTIAQVSKRDAGAYSCIASNEVGKAESYTVLKIIPKDEASVVAENHVQTAKAPIRALP